MAKIRSRPASNGMIKKVTRTYLRSDEMMTEYMRISEERRLNNEIVNPFEDWKNNLVKEFNNWVIIKNEFPYDAVAKISHMISTKRNVPFDWSLLNEEELKEFAEIKNTYIKENYDALWENLPRGITIPIHFHLHLIVLKREEI